MSPLPTSALEMTPRNLWAVWSTSNPAFVRSGVAAAVEQDWVLASEGQRGLEEIVSQSANRFVAALPLEDLLKEWAVLEEIERSWISKTFERLLPFSMASYVVLVKDRHDAFEWHSLRARSPEEAIEAASAFGDVISCGRLDDLKTVVVAGRSIVDRADYTRVLTDARPESPEHPAWWLFSRQKPHLVGAALQLLRG